MLKQHSLGVRRIKYLFAAADRGAHHVCAHLCIPCNRAMLCGSVRSWNGAAYHADWHSRILHWRGMEKQTSMVSIGYQRCNYDLPKIIHDCQRGTRLTR